MRINYQLSKRKFGAFVIAASLFELAGCASPYQEKFDLRLYRLDCNQAEEQTVFLNSLKRSLQSEKSLTELELKFNPFAKDRDYKAGVVNGFRETEINNMLADLEACSWNQSWKRKQKRQ
jgi:hypothetical protein